MLWKRNNCSRMSAESKRWALGNFFPCEFGVYSSYQKCRGDSESPECTDLEVWQIPIFCAAKWQIPIFRAAKHVFFRKSPLRSGSPYVPKKCKEPDSCSPLHDVGKTWQIRTEKYFSSAQHFFPIDMLERWQYVCRVKITCTILPTNRFDSTTMNLMRCFINWISLRILCRSRNTQPHLKEKYYTHEWAMSHMNL